MPSHSTVSKTFWMSIAPGTVVTFTGWPGRT